MRRKRCFKCGKRRFVTKFYVHPQMSDGLLGKCIDCTKNDVRTNRKGNVDYYRTYDRERGNRQSPEYMRDWRAKNPEKYKAQTAVNNAVRDGRLTKKPCKVCGAKKVHGHHANYSKPLNVTWLCPAHHKEVHI